MWIFIIYSGLAGLVGTSLGGALGILCEGKGKKVMSSVLGFAAGVMLSVVCFDLMPEAYDESVNLGFGAAVAVVPVFLGVIIGITLIFLLNYLLDSFSRRKKGNIVINEQLYLRESMAKAEDKSDMLKAGMVMFFAIAVHNFPEGMAIGSGGAISYRLGAVMAIVLALHNIPEGMAMAVPMVAGGLSKGKAVLYTAIAGGVTLLGGAFGVALGGISRLIGVASVSVAGGAMLCVTFGEIIPESLRMDDGKLPVVLCLAGIMAGFLFVKLL